ncbi:phage tail spike protein [Streptococcus cristatus]|uniref:phage tail spike protein n=1 Tax=Streptococcus cristatus TaxID=45634 RepID=UPI0039C1FE4F
MRPILYSKNETRFDTYGLGEIDALKGNATRERNGNYSAYLEYPASGPLASVFEKEMKFKADAGTRTKNQTFEIVRIVKDSSSTIKIYAQHISHKLEYMSVRHGIKVSGTADLALKTWAKNLVGDYHFDTWSDIDTVLPITFLVDKMENARLALGGVEGSILDIWGGEYEFDNQTVRLHKRLGRRAPTVLEYGRNILSAESDESIESAYTSVVPFATYTPESQEGDSRQQDPVLVTIPESYVDSKYVSMYANRRIKVVDFSSEFKDEGTGESKKKDIPTPEKLKALAIKYMESNRIGAPKINTKIEYVDLAQTLDYAEQGWIEELELCDIVPVYYPEIGITEDDAKVTKVVYDFLNDRNESVEFGIVGESIRSAMTGGLAGRLDDLEKSQQSLENRQSEMVFELPKYLLDAKGNRVWNETPDENIEHKVGDIWFEKNGLYQRLYIWNGEMWEKRIDTEDVSKVGEKFDAEVKKINQSMATQTQQTTQALRTAGANASAIEAAKGAITKLNQDLASAKQNNQAAIDRLKSDFANAQRTANDQTALLKSDLANIRTKQTQAESEIAKQVQALNAAKTELAGVKSAQATFEQTTTRRLAELANVADGKANKSELLQTAEELSSKIASVQAGSSRNYFRNSRSRSFTTNEQATYDYRLFIVPDFWQNKDRLKRDYVRLSFDVTFPVALTRDTQANVHFSAHPWYAYRDLVFKGGTTGRQHFEFTIDLSGAAETYQTNNVFIRFGTNYGFPAGLQVVIENAMLSIGNYYPAYQPAYEDQDERVSAVESTFKQKADSIEASVSSLREGLSTKADSSALTLLSDRISASVKSLETDTQNKLDSKLSTTEFDVRASGIRQEIVNATKDKADKALVTAEAGRLREELASLQVGENLFINSEFKNLRDNGQRYTANGKTYQNMIAPYWYNPYNAGLPNAQNNQHGYFDTETFSDTVFAFNESDGSRHWKALSTDFKIGVITAGEYYFSADLYATDLGTHIKFGFYYHNSTGKLNFYAGQTKIEVTEKGRWVRLGAPLKVNDDIDLTKKVQFYIYGYNFASNSILYLKKPKVSKGRLKSDWSPALEDVDGLITEAKATFERTAQGLRTDLSAVQAYVNADGSRAEALRTYSREETARQITAERKLIEAGYVGKATYAEDVKGISRRFEELTVGGRNLIGVFNTKPVKSSFDRETYKLTARTTQNTTRPTLMLQFRWADGSYGAAVTISETGQFARKFKITKPYSELRVKFNCNKEDAVLLFTGKQFIEQNTDYYFTGDLINLSPNDSQADFLKIEKATIPSSWSPAPEDATSYADTKLAEFRQGIDGQLASVQTALNTANGSLTNFNNWKQSAQETLNKVGRVETGLNETKSSLAEFKRTAEGQLSTITQQVAGKASQTDFQRIQETSKLYERLIGSTEKEVADKVSRMALTNELFQVEVSKNLGLRTVQYQMANAWAVQNLNSNGDIISQINMTGPNVRIQGESIHLDGKALIDNGIIKNAMIESMLADKITAGTLNAANVNIVNLNANKIVGLDANFIKSKIELAFIEWMRGKTISAQNDAMQINLNDGHVLFYNDDASIKRVLAGYPTQFIRYENKQENGQNHGRTIIGSNRNGTNVWKSASFAGLVIDNNSNNSVDKIYQFGDYNYFRHAQGDDGWNFSVVTQTLTPGLWTKNSEIWARHFVVPRETKSDTDNPTKFIRLEESVAAIWDILNHAASGQVTMTQAMQNLINSRKANWNIIRNVG